MWLAKPLYEALPAVSIGAGSAALAVGWYVRASYWPGICLGLGAGAIVLGLVLLLRRRSYRSSRSRKRFEEVI